MLSSLRIKAHWLPIFLWASAFWVVPQLAYSQQVDITAKVKTRNPEFEREIQKTCEESCVGNERKGWLHAVSYRRIDNRNYELHVEVRFRNRHHVDPLYLLGTKVSEGGDLFNHTVIVKTRGRVDKQTCVSVIEDMWVENDYQGIFTALLERENSKGKKTIIHGCAEYLR